MLKIYQRFKLNELLFEKQFNLNPSKSSIIQGQSMEIACLFNKITIKPTKA